jgi:very-short-patch-repair endonuclease
MGDSKSNAVNTAAWRLVRRQYGVVEHGQLVALGFGTKAIKHRIASGRLHRVARGIYAVGRPQLTREGRWMAALLACGDGAVLSYGSAAALWEIGREGGRIEVSVRRRCRHRRHGLLVRSRPSLPAQEGIPVTTAPRTALDQATQLDDSALERLVNEADALDRIDPESLRLWLDERPGEPGVKRLRKMLDRQTFRLSDAELEVLFRPLALAAGLPQPLTKQWVNDFEVDFYWPSLGLVVETDSLRYHRTASKQSRDLLRDQTHTSRGLTTLRFNHWQVKYEPTRVRTVLAATARRLAPSRPPENPT